MAPKFSMLMNCWCHLDLHPPFLIHFRDHLNLLNCNKYNAKNVLFTISGLPIWHQKPINKSCLFKPPSWTSFFYFMLIVSKKLTLGTPSKSSGRQNGTQIIKVVPKCWKSLVDPPHWADSNNAKTLGNAKWIGLSFCLCFSLFELSSFSGTFVKQVVFF